MIGILFFTFTNELIANADSNTLKDKNGQPLQVSKDYYLHIIHNGSTGYYPWYETNLAGWQFGQTTYLGIYPNSRSIVKLQARNDVMNKEKTPGESIASDDKIAIQVVHHLDTSTFRYWTINKLNYGFPATDTERYVYLDTWKNHSKFQLKKLPGEVYARTNSYNLGVLKADNTFHSVGRQGTNGPGFVGQGVEIIRILENNNTKVEFIPVN